MMMMIAMISYEWKKYGNMADPSPSQPEESKNLCRCDYVRLRIDWHIVLYRNINRRWNERMNKNSRTSSFTAANKYFGIFWMKYDVRLCVAFHFFDSNRAASQTHSSWSCAPKFSNLSFMGRVWAIFHQLIRFSRMMCCVHRAEEQILIIFFLLSVMP